MPHNHVCGLYFSEDYKRRYLPQVELKSHTTINPVCFTTQLTQTFENPNENVLSQVRYAFPLYDGVAVCGYRISYGDKTIHGLVEQKNQAKKTYKAAVDRGEAAGLLESLPAGVFGVTLGNVPAKTAVVVNITYCRELKHDAAIDGLRYMLPTSIAPRYGSYPGEILKSNTTPKGRISITVDVDMANSAIHKVQSPSHPIAVSMGATSTTKGSNSAPFTPSQASATLTQGSTELADDFILQLLIDDISKPQAILETHPELPHQRALMTTLVPKFALESGHPEIVFIADQSGSMSGAKNAALVKALKVFLKSLPLGVRFNICAFGNDFKFLFPKSQPYNEDNLNTALSFVESFKASYGGTEILKPITAAFEQHLADLPFEVMLLTDGEIWEESAVFDYINEQVREKNVDARVFALGIGTDVSHTLVEGVARAGNGFAQFVVQDEQTDEKVMRMLKGALYAHTKDYQLEVHYDDTDEESMSDVDDFEIVERVNDCLKISAEPTESTGRKRDKDEESKPMSFFDDSADLDKPFDGTTGRYAHLPSIDTPKLLQAPNTIPPLFPFNRTTLYLLLGPEAPQKKVVSLTLRAKSAQGPLELNIPVFSAGANSTATIHQLAARKATQDLEEGRGWLQSATIEGTSVKAKFESRFDEIVERECVRLGEKFQVAGKWTSFVAVEANGEKEEAAVEERPQTRGGRTKRCARMTTGGAAPRKQLASTAARKCVDPTPASSSCFGSAAAPGGLNSGSFARSTAPPGITAAGLFGSASQQAQRTSAPQAAGGLFGGAAQRVQNPTSLTSIFRSAPQAPPPPPAASAKSSTFQTGAFSSSPSYSPASPGEEAEESEETDSSDDEMGFALFDDDVNSPAASSTTPAQFLMADAEEMEDARDLADAQYKQAPAHMAPLVQPDQAALQQYAKEMGNAAAMPLPDEDDPDVADDEPASRNSTGSAFASISTPPAKKKARVSSTSNAAMSADDVKIMGALIDLQTFSGAWGWSSQLLSLLGVTGASVKAALGQSDETVMATALSVAFLEKRVAGKKEVWEMVVNKAKNFLAQSLGAKESAEDVVGKAAHVFG